MKNKKAKMDFYDDGPEYLFVLLVIGGAIIGLITRSLIINYTIMFLFGIIIGIYYYIHQFHRKFILTLVTVALFIGYTLASYKSNWKLLLILYIGGSLIGYYLKKEKWLE